MGQPRSLGYTGGPTCINNQGQVFNRIDIQSRRVGLDCGNHIVKKEMPGLIVAGFGDFS